MNDCLSSHILHPQGELPRVAYAADPAAVRLLITLTLRGRQSATFKQAQMYRALL